MAGGRAEPGAAGGGDGVPHRSLWCGGRIEGAVAVKGMQLPAFAAGVPGAGIVIVWVIAGQYQPLVMRYLFDVQWELRFGG